jgi:hypothetical protein
MLKEVIAVFDICKTNKKFMLFNEGLKVVHEEEVRFNEIPGQRLIIPGDDQTKAIYISGGFARNEIFVRLPAGWLHGKDVHISETDNTTALGAAMVVRESAFGKDIFSVDPGLKRVKNELSL